MRHLYEIAKKNVGLKEWPGAKHNPEIVAMFEAADNGWVKDDETPWCAAFVGAILGQAGMSGTGRLNARSYLNWGEAVDLAKAVQGDIVVFWRGTRDGWQGHVGFFSGLKDGKVQVLGGNQGNAVSIAEYPVSRLLSVRRAKPRRASPAQSRTLQASGIAKIASASAPVVAAVADVPWQTVAALGGLAAVVLIATVVIDAERMKKWRRGDR